MECRAICQRFPVEMLSREDIFELSGGYFRGDPGSD